MVHIFPASFEALIRLYHFISKTALCKAGFTVVGAPRQSKCGGPYH
jgi:hypothetical protein